MMLSPHFSMLAFLATILPLAQVDAICPLQGPVYPVPKSLSTSKTFMKAITNLTSLFNTATSSNNTSSGSLFDGLNTSFSLEIFSTHEKQSLLSKHYSAPALTSYQYGTKKLDSNTIYRIGSITKLVSVYTLLLSIGDIAFNTPITHYVPELLAASQATNASTNNAINQVSWQDITLGDLASQTADIGRDYAGFGQVGGLLLPIPNTAALGLPPANSTARVLCQGGGYCTRSQFFAGFTKRHPIYAPGSSPIYSNAAFQILGYALENITGASFPELVEEHLFKPLNLNHSSWSLPASNGSAIIPDGSSYALPLGDESPAGGMYSTLTDLSNIGRSILSSTLLPPALTRRWMKPRSFTSSPLFAVGAPWEISRYTGLGNSHIVDTYSKNGDLPGYSSILILVPDWNVGFTILTAGKNANANTALLANMISETLFPAIEEAAREEAEESFSGIYTAPASSKLNSSISLTTSSSQPGLLVTRWISNGTNMLTSLVAGPSVHLYPTGLTNTNAKGETEMGFRAVYENPGAKGVGGMFGSGCVSWGNVDQIYWGDVASDEFVVTVGRDGRASIVSPRVLGDGGVMVR